ncbi:MAG: hypothetical protein ABIG70_09790 [Pseudomonadota bacterium]
MAKLLNELSDGQREWLTNNPIFPPELELFGRNDRKDPYKILERDDDGRINTLSQRCGFKGFVLKVEDPDTSIIYAAKICIADDYDDKRNEFLECQLSAQLRPAGDLFVIPQRVGRVQRFPGMPGPQDAFVCFISDWIEGETVQQIATGESDTPLDLQLICSVIREVLRAVQFLKHKQLKHDDLHWGNIMVRPKDPALLLNDSEKFARTISIIDMGSLKSIAQPTTKSKDDELYLIDLIVKLFNAAYRNRLLVAENPLFFAKLRRLAIAFSDEDHLRHYADERDKSNALDELVSAIGKSLPKENGTVFHPFEAISAEHLTDDKVLLQLFVDTLPWFGQAFAAKPLVLSGPRGCGKSMLFRYMAARSHRPVDNLDNLTGHLAPSFFGIYIGCATHLQNSLMWLARKPGRVEENAGAITTFFGLIVVRELFRALAVAAINQSSRDYFGIENRQLEHFIDDIKVLFGQEIESPRLGSKSRTEHFADDLDRARIRIQRDLLESRPPFLLLPDNFISDVTSKLGQHLPVLAEKKIVFLLDDYSSSRVHTDIQSLLTKIIFERHSSHYFKVSCEKYGFSTRDIDNVLIDSEREFDIIDAGAQASFEMAGSVKKDFITKLINRRLEAAGWKGRAENLLGDSGEMKNDVSLAKYIRKTGAHKGQHSFYYGLDHLSRLWSGDIATILQMVRDIFIRANVQCDVMSAIPKNIQHQSIVQVSKAFRERVAGYYPLGERMAQILNAFGNMSREILIKGSETKSGQPRRLIRIEMTKEKSLPLLTLIRSQNPEAEQLAKELLRRGVFIEYSDSRGKEGVGTETARWQLRKIYLPSFGTALIRNSYIDIKTTNDFLDILVNPEKFKTIMVTKYCSNPSGSLFDELTQAEKSENEVEELDMEET